MNTPPPDPGPDAVSTEHRYPPRGLVRDYLLVAAGLAITLSVLALAQPGRTAMAVLGVLGALSGFLALRTARRQVLRYTLSAAGFGRGRHGLPWQDLAGVRLRHFTTRRAGAGSAWMELRLAGPGARITVDSELDGFLAVARAAHRAAIAKGLTLDPATVANFRALGLDDPGPAPA